MQVLVLLLLGLAACEAQTATGSSSKPSDQLPPLIPLKLLLGNSKYRNAQVRRAFERVINPHGGNSLLDITADDTQLPQQRSSSCALNRTGGFATTILSPAADHIIAF